MRVFDLQAYEQWLSESPNTDAKIYYEHDGKFRSLFLLSGHIVASHFAVKFLVNSCKMTETQAQSHLKNLDEFELTGSAVACVLGPMR